MNVNIPLPYETPPLSANQRLHWRRRADITAQVRSDAHTLVRVAGAPRNCVHVAVSLHYAPARNGRRDADNLVPTLKALCDGLVDYGLVPDDTPQWMTKVMPVIEPKSTTGRGRMWLELTIEEA